MATVVISSIASRLHCTTPFLEFRNNFPHSKKNIKSIHTSQQILHHSTAQFNFKEVLPFFVAMHFDLRAETKLV
uniref:Uncharacterized protein n=1 Tax=Strigamia maritima TaxID=126957 RepID=T1IQF2_STRMM